MANNSRAEYFRKRREGMRQFMVMVDRDTLDAFDTVLKEQGTTKATWLRAKIAEELKRKK